MLHRVAPARSVRIAVPAYTSMCVDTRESIIHGCRELVAAGIEVQDFDALSGNCYVDYARCVLAARFLRSPADCLVFIDADVGFEPEDLLRLCQSTRPLVAGIYPKKIEPREWPVSPKGPEIWGDADGLIECDMVPTGFMRIDRSVFDALDVPTFRDRTGETIGAYFKTTVRDGEYWGEDVEFCRLYREAGGHVRAFHDMKLRHWGLSEKGEPEMFTGIWGHWLRSQMKEAA